MTKTTFVTSFYDLARIEGNDRRRTSEQYYTFAEEILKRPIDLVFIGEESDVARVKNIRADAGLAERTHCLIIPFESLPAYQHIQTLKEIVDEKGVYGIKNDERLTAHYVALTWSKLFFLQQATRSNPFLATHFCWVDFGYFHMREQFDYLKPGAVDDECFTSINDSWHREGHIYNKTFRINLLFDFDEEEIVDSRRYYSKDNFQVAATVMGGTAEIIDIISEKFQKQVNLCLKLRIATPEENILGRIAYFFPELFDLTLGYYSTSLQNFAQITKFPENVYKLAVKFRKDEKRQQSFDTLSKLAEGIISRRADTMSSDAIYEIFYELIICSFYVNYASYRKYRDFFRTWLNINNIKPNDLLNMNLGF